VFSVNKRRRRSGTIGHLGVVAQEVLMDIPSLSMALSQNRILNEVGVAMLSKSLDTMEDAGAALVNTIDSAAELSVNPDIGSNIDIRI
jgi:hypothetical protein